MDNLNYTTTYLALTCLTFPNHSPPRQADLDRVEDDIRQIKSEKTRLENKKNKEQRLRPKHAAENATIFLNRRSKDGESYEEQEVNMGKGHVNMRIISGMLIWVSDMLIWGRGRLIWVRV